MDFQHDNGPPKPTAEFEQPGISGDQLSAVDNITNSVLSDQIQRVHDTLEAFVHSQATPTNENPSILDSNLSDMSRKPLITEHPDEYDPPNDPTNDTVTRNQTDLCGNVKVTYEAVEKNATGGNITKKGVSPTSTPWSQSLNQAAMTFTRYYDAENSPVYVTVTIRSEDLVYLVKSTLRTILAHLRVQTWSSPPPVTVNTNSMSIIHSLGELWEAVDSEKGTAKGRDELRCLLKHIEIYESETLQARDNAFKERVVTYSKLWILFAPGSEVVARSFQGKHQIFKVYTHFYTDIRGGVFTVGCWASDWDGEKIVKQFYELPVSRFNDERNVVELPCYPLAFYNSEGEDHNQLRKNLVSRGKSFQKFCSQSTLGRAQLHATNCVLNEEVSPTEPPWGDPFGGRITHRFLNKGGDVAIIVDPFLYKQYAPGNNFHLGDMTPKFPQICECTYCGRDGERKKWEEVFCQNVETGYEAQPQSGLWDQFYAELPPRVLGFVLNDKMWAQIDIETIREESEEEKMDRQVGWNELAIDGTQKQHIQKLVQSHLRNKFNGEKKIRDLVPGKGDGLVLLFHGVPGTGKTMTAETLARREGRYLMRIDASDFQYDNQKQVSIVLKKHFHMANAWGLILLLDEADVFLQLRARQELGQNALVAILLRYLEYFQGVLIMTTNRLLSIDNAVESRIHYSVRFRHPNEEYIKTIAMGFVKQLTKEACSEEDKQAIIRYFRENAVDLRQRKFTGRDIRNVLTTAQTLDYPRLTYQNLKGIINQLSSFRQELRDVYTQREISRSGIDEFGL